MYVFIYLFSAMTATKHSLKYLLSSAGERNSFKFKMT